MGEKAKMEHTLPKKTFIEGKTSLEDVLDCIKDGISILDGDLNILYVNKSMEKWYAHQLPLLGRKCYEAYRERKKPCDVCPSLRTLSSGKQAMDIVPFTGPEGVKGWLELFTFPLKESETGLIIGVIEYVRDITERKRAEEALRESEEKYRTLVENITIGVYRNTGDFQGRFLQANPATARIFGFASVDEIVDVPVSSLYQNPADRELFLDEIRQAGFLRNKELRLKKKDGAPIWASVTAKAQFTADGEIEWMDGVIDDITERKRAEEALRESKRNVSDMLESISDAFFALDNRWRFTYVNSRAGKLLRKSRDELTGKNIWEEFPEAVGSTFYNEYHKALDKDVPVSFEEYYPPLNTWYGVRAYPYHGGLSVYFRDITDRKLAEEKLRQTMAELERSNQELEQFAYVASHDLKEPLRIVKGYVQLLARRYGDRLDKDAGEFIEYASNGVDRMDKLINDLLAYSRVGTDDRPLKPVDCEAVFDRVAANLATAIEEHGVVVTHGPLPEVTANDTRLAQLLQNLIGNAIKFRGGEPPRIHVSAGREEKEWLFSVSDNGIGIAPEHAGRIFEVFQRLHGRSKYPGTGIGLAICKKIVQQLGGRIWVESKPGEGATFFFTIPDRGGNEP
jgi:PAS domain S-box-containing protein